MTSFHETNDFLKLDVQTLVDPMELGNEAKCFFLRRIIELRWFMKTFYLRHVLRDVSSYLCYKKYLHVWKNETENLVE